MLEYCPRITYCIEYSTPLPHQITIAVSSVANTVRKFSLSLGLKSSFLRKEIFFLLVLFPYGTTHIHHLSSDDPFEGCLLMALGPKTSFPQNKHSKFFWRILRWSGFEVFYLPSCVQVELQDSSNIVPWTNHDITIQAYLWVEWNLTYMTPK